MRHLLTRLFPACRAVCLCVGLMLASLATPGPAAAQSADPFNRSAPQQSQPAQVQPETPAPQALGLLDRWSRWIAVTQRAASAELRAAMAAIRDSSSPLPYLIGMGIGFLYGAFHAAGPGHGKAVVISYFLSRSARIPYGLWMGVRIAATHVASAVLLVGLVVVAFGGTLPADVENMAVVRIISYLAIATLGAWMLARTVTALRRGQRVDACCDHAHGHAPGHTHDHHHHDHHHHDHHHHDHGEANQGQSRLAALIVGAVPCTGAVLVLLFSVANGMPLAGLLVVIAIGVGMAATMAVLGLAAILARHRVERWAQSRPRQSWITTALDIAGPAFIFLLGTSLTVLTL